MLRAIEDHEKSSSGALLIGWTLMTEGKEKPPTRSDMTFGEALKRFLETTRAEIFEAREKIDKDHERVDRYVEDLEREIQRGGKRPRKRFRL
jgi:hypothetical protein